MKLIDSDFIQNVLYIWRSKHPDKERALKYFWEEFEVFKYVADQCRAATAPELRIIQAKYDGWIPCKKELPETGANVILTFEDTFHTHKSWPRIAVMPAWICNVDEERPKGEWAIEGRLGNYCVDIESGIAWMPMPEPSKELYGEESRVNAT